MITTASDVVNTKVYSLIVDLAESADQTGCTPDLAVVDAKILYRLCKLVEIDMDSINLVNPDEAD